MPGITLVGLGPGGPDQITREAWDFLASASEVWLQTRGWPAVAGLPPSVTVHSFDDTIDDSESTESHSSRIGEQLLRLGRRPQGVTYAVPGHPLIAGFNAPELIRKASEEGLAVRIIGGQSLPEAALTALEIDAFHQLTLCDALSLTRAHVPPFPPDAPALVTRINSLAVASHLRMVLGMVYPAEHTVKLVHGIGTGQQSVENVPLEEIDRSDGIGVWTCMYLPPLEPGTSLEGLQEIVAHLRAPEGCPWDRQQTHASLRRHLLEETYETIAAMDTGDAAGMREEFGDLLLQVMLNAQIGSELGEFTLHDVSKTIRDKIYSRHPHVFGDLKLDGVEGVLTNWERLKERERDAKDDLGGLLEGVPLALPALSQAQEYQERAARVGFDWPEVQGVLDKVAEEMGEVESATEAEALASELGDLLFALVNLARWKGVDAESALRAANLRFRKRFGFVEQGARRRGQRLSEMRLDEMEALWQQAKALGV